MTASEAANGQRFRFSVWLVLAAAHDGNLADVFESFFDLGDLDAGRAAIAITFR